MYYNMLFLLLLLLNVSKLPAASCPNLQLECWETENRPSLVAPEEETFGQCGTGFLKLNCEICAHELERAKDFCRARGKHHGGVGYMYNSDKTGPHLIIKTSW